MDTQIILAKNLGHKAWLEYLLEIGSFSHFHTPHMSEFYSNYKNVEDISFFCFEKKNPSLLFLWQFHLKKKKNFHLAQFRVIHQYLILN